MMREAFAHDAVLGMDPDADAAAPGAAITVALCGGWSHEPPCRLAPHHTAVERNADRLRVRVLFAVEASHEAEVRQSIDRALSGGQLTGEDATSTRWQLLNSTPSAVSPGERDHARRLIKS